MGPEFLVLNFGCWKDKVLNPENSLNQINTASALIKLQHNIYKVLVLYAWSLETNYAVVNVEKLLTFRQWILDEVCSQIVPLLWLRRRRENEYMKENKDITEPIKCKLNFAGVLCYIWSLFFTSVDKQKKSETITVKNFNKMKTWRALFVEKRWTVFSVLLNLL